jgi:dynein heavy chain
MQSITTGDYNLFHTFFSTGLFEKHKLLFSFQMTIKIMQADDNLKQEELDFFVKGNISLEKSSRKKPYTWLSDQGWQDVLKLCTVAPDVFSNLADDIERNEQVWKEVRS